MRTPLISLAAVLAIALSTCSDPLATDAPQRRGRLFGRVLGGTGLGIGNVHLVLAGPFGRRELVTPSNWWEAGNFSFDGLPDDGIATLAASVDGDTVVRTIDFARLTPFPTTMRLPRWRLAWVDEFDGDELDRDRWHLWHSPVEGARVPAHYDRDQVLVENGLLRLRTDAAGVVDGRILTGGMNSIYAQRYGRFEIRARLPSSQGVWPAHWLVDADSLDPVSEIDIMELLGHDPHRVYFHNHWFNSAGIVTGVGGSSAGPAISQDFHTFRVDWYVGTIVWYVDGIERFRSIEGVGDRAMFLRLCTAVAGSWGGPTDETTVYPQHHDIDWVRVYRLER
jgi:hypothetical protein